jgi:hypothetical protein
MPPSEVERLRRIAFVSRRFADLQGLRPAALGAGLIGFSVLWSLAEPVRGAYIWIFSAAQLMTLVAAMPIARYYEQAFGRVATARSSDAVIGQSLWIYPGGGAAYVVLMALAGDVLLHLAFKPDISLAAVALTIYSLMILVRDGVLRVYYAIGVAAGSYAILLSMTPEVGHVESRVCGVVGLALFALGLLDHRLLAVSLGQPRNVYDASPPSPLPLVRLRLLAAGACLAVLGVYIVGFGWPSSARGVTYAMYMVVGLITLGVSLLEPPIDFWRRSRPYSELTRARAQRLLARVRGDDQPVQSIRYTVPPALDVPGHVLMPLLIGCGAIVDVRANMVGMPSMLALSLAASHLWIAVRDWPRRTHYLLGSAAAAISAVHHMFIAREQQLEWFVWFLILVSSAMVVEGLFDLRLHPDNSPDVSEAPHVDPL